MAAFDACSACGYELFEQGAGAVAFVVEAVGEYVHDVGAGVQADEVGEGERAHREVAAEFHDPVDGVGLGDALHPGVEGLVDHGHEDAVADEAGAVIGAEWGFAEGGGEGDGAVDDGGRGLQAGDDLDELHEWDGVEEVHPDDAPGGCAGGGGQVGDGDRAGIGGEDDAFVGVHGREAGEEVFFDLGVLDDGLDEPVAAGEFVGGIDVGDACECGVHVGLCDLGFFDELGE